MPTMPKKSRLRDSLLEQFTVQTPAPAPRPKPAIDLSQVSDADLAREWTRRLNLKRDPKNAGRKKSLHPCKYCGEPFGVAEMRRHVPRCPKR